MESLLWFLNGSLVGGVIALCLFLYFTSRKLQEKHRLISDNLSNVLSGVVESHNTLNQLVATMDKKVSETSLRVDAMNNRKAAPVSRFPTHV